MTSMHVKSCLLLNYQGRLYELGSVLLQPLLLCVVLQVSNRMLY